MRLPRLRFTVRRLMLSVAIVAITIQGTRWWRLSGKYWGLADGYARKSAWQRDVLRRTRLGLPGTRLEPVYPPGYDPTESMKACEFLQQKYEYATYHPWLAVPPDPPEPE